MTTKSLDAMSYAELLNEHTRVAAWIRDAVIQHNAFVERAAYVAENLCVARRLLAEISSRVDHLTLDIDAAAEEECASDAGWLRQWEDRS